MKKTFFLFLIVATSVQLSAQEFAIGMKVGNVTSFPTAYLKDALFFDYQTASSDPAPNYSLFMNYHLFKNFRINSEIGFASQDFTFGLQYSEMGAFEFLSGYGERDLVYFGIYPEFRSGEKGLQLFLNAGVEHSQMTRNEAFGVISDKIGYFFNEEGIAYSKDGFFTFAVGGGLDYITRSNIGFGLETKYRAVNQLKKEDYVPNSPGLSMSWLSVSVRLFYVFNKSRQLSGN